MTRITGIRSIDKALPQQYNELAASLGAPCASVNSTSEFYWKIRTAGREGKWGFD